MSEGGVLTLKNKKVEENHEKVNVREPPSARRRGRVKQTDLRRKDKSGVETVVGGRKGLRGLTIRSHPQHHMFPRTDFLTQSRPRPEGKRLNVSPGYVRSSPRPWCNE